MRYEIDSSQISFNGKDAKEVFQVINEACQKLNTDYIVVGAFSRDIILEHVFDAKPGVLTRDIDLAIYLNDWKEYREVINILVIDYGFKKGNKVHEFFSKNGLQLDILPYGEIESDRYLSFPEAPGFRLNMMGFREVRQNSLELIIDNEVVIKTPTPEGMILLKLIAWNDRKPRDVSKKHVVDIGMILDSYFHGNLEYISENHSEVFDELLEFDEYLFSSIVIGKGIKKLLNDNKDSHILLLSILEEILSDKHNSLFINQLSSTRRWEYDYCYKVVEYLYSNIK